MLESTPRSLAALLDTLCAQNAHGGVVWLASECGSGPKSGPNT
jgi:hypothetical protein